MSLLALSTSAIVSLLPASPIQTRGMARPEAGDVTHSTNRATASACAGVGNTYFFLWAHGASMMRDQTMPGLR